MGVPPRFVQDQAGISALWSVAGLWLVATRTASERQGFFGNRAADSSTAPRSPTLDVPRCWLHALAFVPFLHGDRGTDHVRRSCEDSV